MFLCVSFYLMDLLVVLTSYKVVICDHRLLSSQDLSATKWSAKPMMVILVSLFNRSCWLNLSSIIFLIQILILKYQYDPLLHFYLFLYKLTSNFYFSYTCEYLQLGSLDLVAYCHSVIHKAKQTEYT